MSKMRPPQHLERYTTAEAAAEGLEELAESLRADADVRPLVRWSLNLSFWNPEWLTDERRHETILRGISYNNTPPTVRRDGPDTSAERDRQGDSGPRP